MRLLPIGTEAIRTLAIRSLVLAIVLLTAWPAAAQLTRDELAMRNQIYELQQQVQTLQQQLSNQGGRSNLGQPGYSGSQSSGGSDVVPQLLARVQTLEEEMRTLRGRVDQAENEVQQQGADLGKRIDDLRFQLQNGQAGGAPGEAAPPGGPSFGTGYPANGLPPTSGPGGPIPLQGVRRSARRRAPWEARRHPHCRRRNRPARRCGARRSLPCRMATQRWRGTTTRRRKPRRTRC